MRYPKPLAEGGTIGFVAPAFGCTIQPYKGAFENAQKTFQQMGYRMQLGENCYADCGIGISNTPEACGRELSDMYCDKNNDVLISCGGGELMCEILDYVDFVRLGKADPKWFIGYSDNTNFTFLQNTICDTAAIYGPCAGAFGMEPWHPSIKDAFDILTGKKTFVHGYDLWEKESLKSEENPLEPYHTTEQTKLHCFNYQDGMKFHGRLLGGCLDCLSNLVGTKYDKVAHFNQKYGQEGIIWFIESCDLNVLSMRRAMWQLEHAGWFEKTSGFIIGRPYLFDQPIMGLDQYEAIYEVIKKYNVPVIMDADIGHLPPAMPIISGSLADVSAKNNRITIEADYR
jgi:muramoyltetrapeptide carboxypeptidase LdcA involved in peptidoglycan recycling